MRADGRCGEAGRCRQHGLPQLSACAGGGAGPPVDRARQARAALPLPRDLPSGLAGQPRSAAVVAHGESASGAPGSLGDIVSHTLDLALHLVGDVTEVCGMMETFTKERTIPGTDRKGPVDVDDATLSLVRFANGAIGSLEGTRFATGRKNYNRFEINGSKGSIAFNLERLNELEVYLEEGPDSGFKNVMVTEAKHPYAGAWWPPGHTRSVTSTRSRIRSSISSKA